MDGTVEDIRRARLTNTVVRFRETVLRERSFGADSFGCDVDPTCFYVNVQAQSTLRFRGDLVGPVHLTDFRLYLPALIGTYAARGGVIRQGRVGPESLDPLLESHDLTVLATGGRDSLAGLFPEVAGESLGRALRATLVGLFDGVAVSNPPSISLTIAPGRGGLFLAPMWTAEGVKTAILFGAKLDGPWLDLVRRDHSANPESLTTSLLEFLRSVAADSHTPIEDGKFRLAGPGEFLRGAVELRVRRPWAEPKPGKFIVGLGDAVTTVDPLIGQGANLASSCAGALADAIVHDFAFDGIFVREWERRQWELAEPVTRWNRLALGDPPPQVVDLLVSCASNQPVADAFAQLYENPRRAWPSLASPQRVDGFIQRAMGRA